MQKKKDAYRISALENMVIKGRSEYALIQLPDQSIDMIFTSPPYYNARKVLVPRASRNESSSRLRFHLIFIKLTFNGFDYVKEPPLKIDRSKKYFWLSHMDENERETDATIVYNGKAVSIDIGFIGKGNPEITLDKVTRFGNYKRIGDVDPDMSIIIIVDTVAEGSDLFNKAARVNGHVFQMKHNDWAIEVSKTICEIMGFTNDFSKKKPDELESFFEENLKLIDLNTIPHCGDVRESIGMRSIENKTHGKVMIL